MKKYFRVLLVLGLCLPVMVYASAAAENGSSGTTTTPKTTDTTSKTATTPTNTTATDDSQARAQRLADRKTELKTKLSSTEQKHLKTVCKAAQGKASSISDQGKNLGATRDKIYATIIDKLNALVTKLKAKSVDTTELQTEITNLQGQITAFNSDAATYQQDISDLVAMDCGTDPTAFQATLDATRSAREKLLQDGTGIKAYVTSTIKPTLQKIHDQLAQTETTTGGKK